MSDSSLQFNNNLIKFRIDEIKKINDYCNLEIKERKECTKKLSIYIIGFDYADKISITLSA